MFTFKNAKKFIEVWKGKFNNGSHGFWFKY
jgi:hypothetical protein